MAESAIIQEGRFRKKDSKGNWSKDRWFILEDNKKGIFFHYYDKNPESKIDHKNRKGLFVVNDATEIENTDESGYKPISGCFFGLKINPSGMEISFCYRSGRDKLFNELNARKDSDATVTTCPACKGTGKVPGALWGKNACTNCSNGYVEIDPEDVLPVTGVPMEKPKGVPSQWFSYDCPDWCQRATGANCGKTHYQQQRNGDWVADTETTTPPGEGIDVIVCGRRRLISTRRRRLSFFEQYCQTQGILPKDAEKN